MKIKKIMILVKVKLALLNIVNYIFLIYSYKYVVIGNLYFN